MEKLSDPDSLNTKICAEISHKLRTPLTAIRGFIELLLKSDNLNNSQQEDLQLILKNEIKIEQVLQEIEEILIESSEDWSIL